MTNYSGYRDKFGTPINMGHDVLYKGVVHKVKTDHRGRIVFQSQIGIGDLEFLHDKVVVIKEHDEQIKH